MPPLVPALLGCVLLLVTAIGARWLLRATRAPGAAVLGGVLAGVLLGPTIGGRFAPSTWERVFVGARAQRQARDAILARRDADLLAAGVVGADDEMRRTLLGATDDDLHAARQAWADAAWRHQAPLRWMTLAVVAGALLLAGMSATPRAPPRPNAASALSIAAWSAGVPAAIVYAFLCLTPPLAWREQALVIAAVVIGPFLLVGADRAAAETAERGGPRLIQASGRIASIVAIGLVLAALPASRVGCGLVLLGLPAGWFVLRAATPTWVGLREGVLVPALAAFVAVRVDVFSDAAFWPLVALLAASGDGRWGGATLGAMLTGGRRWLRTMRLTMGSTACGPTMLAVAAVGLHAGALPRSLGLAVLAGATLIELSVPMRRRMTARLLELEEDVP